MTHATEIHPFEQAGLGRAPFRLVGMEAKVYVSCPGAPAQPAGTCDYCGNGIKYCCQIESADGKQFVVGNECVRKTDRESLVNASEFEKALLKQKREIARERTRAKRLKDQERINAAYARYDFSPTLQAEFASRPHPFSSLAAEGKTYADYITYMRQNGGTSGNLLVARKIETASA